MSDDPRAAADYLRKPDADQCAMTRRGMMERLAMAYLAEHPADGGERVTAEWLATAGFVAETSDELDPGAPPVWAWRDEHGQSLLTLAPPALLTLAPPVADGPLEPWAAFLGELEDLCEWPQDIHARAQVRDILTALGQAARG